MPKPVGSSRKSAGKVGADGRTPAQRWEALLGGLDPAVQSLLRKDPRSVQERVWDDLQLQPEDVDPIRASTPYWCVLVEANTLACSVRGFADELDMVKALQKLRAGSDDFFVIPFVGRPLQINFEDDRMVLLGLDGKKAYVANEDNTLSCVAADTIEPFDTSYALVPLNALSALPQRPRPGGYKRKRRDTKE